MQVTKGTEQQPCEGRLEAPGLCSLREEGEEVSHSSFVESQWQWIC